MNLHRMACLIPLCVIISTRQSAFAGATIYSDGLNLETETADLPGDRVNISFTDFPVHGIYYPPLTISNIMLLGRVFVVEPAKGLPFQYLNNYDSDFPLTVHFPTGAKAFGAFFSSWLPTNYPASIKMTATTGGREVFNFSAFTISWDVPPVNASYFGLVSDSTLYDITISDGAIFNAGTALPSHEEMIAEIFAVINKPPSLDVWPSAGNRVTLGINGAAGQTLVLLSSTNLVKWKPVVTNTLAGDRWLYSDTQTNSSITRFYRIVAQ